METCSNELEIDSSFDLSEEAGAISAAVVSIELGFPKVGTKELAPTLNLNSGAPARNPEATRG
jgi:hypothetical protein